MLGDARLAVVIPAYKVSGHILGVISEVGPECDLIYVVDDACPEHSGDIVESQCKDARVRVLRHDKNQGVGAAVTSGYRQALNDSADVIVKVDGDGQMDPKLLLQFVAPILRGEADYTKGNRFFDLTNISEMPFLRRLGNLGLSFMSKASTGYWDIFDPTNGYTAIHASAASLLPLHNISKRYFFETDMLFRLNTLRATVVDIPMHARYGDEVSSLKVSRALFEFSAKHCKNFMKRIAYNYYLRDLSIASLELMCGGALLAFGASFGALAWWGANKIGEPATVGTVMIPTLSVMLGVQLLLAFLAYDIASVPRYSIQNRLTRNAKTLIQKESNLR